MSSYPHTREQHSGVSGNPLETGEPACGRLTGRAIFPPRSAYPGVTRELSRQKCLLQI